MSEPSTNPLEELAESVTSIEEVENETESLQELHDQADDVYLEAETTLESLNEESKQTIIDAYDRSLDKTVSQLFSETNRFDPGQFSSEVEQLLDEIQSILRHPEAENVVKDTEEWLVEAGADPFEEKSRENLIGIIERNVDRAKEASEMSRVAFHTLSEDLGSSRTRLAKLVKNNLKDVGTVSAIDSTSVDLDDIATRWPYPWKASFEQPAGELVQERADQLLFDQIEAIIDESSTLEQFITLVKERLLPQKETLEDIGSTVERIQERMDALRGSDVGSPTEVAIEHLENNISAASSFSQIETSVDGVLEILNKMNDVATESIDRFHVQDSPDSLPSFISGTAGKLSSKHETLLSIREEILSGETVEYQERIEEFNTQINEAEKNLEQVENAIKGEIATGQNIADVFELSDKDRALNEIKLAVSRADTIGELIENAHEVETIRQEIRGIVTEKHLNEEAAGVFEAVLAVDGTISPDTDTISAITDRTGLSKSQVLENLLSLQEEGLVFVSVRGA